MTIFRRKNVNVKDYINHKFGAYQETLLHYYARLAGVHQNKEKCKFLLQCGADINSADSFFKTPLHNAVTAGNYEIVKLLLNNNAYVNSENKDKNTPLYNGVLKNVKICSILLKHGADPNIVNAYNESAVYRSVTRGSTEICKLLLQYGGDVTIMGSVKGKRSINLESLEDKSIHNLCSENLKNSAG